MSGEIKDDMSDSMYVQYMPSELEGVEDLARDIEFGLDVWLEWGDWVVNLLLAIEDHMFSLLDEEQKQIFERYLQESEYPSYVEQMFYTEAFYALIGAWKQFDGGNYSMKPISTRQLTFTAKTQKFMGFR